MGMLYWQATIAPRVDDERLSHEYRPFHHKVKYDRGHWPRQRWHRRGLGRSSCVVVPESMSIETGFCATREEARATAERKRIVKWAGLLTGSGETVGWVKS